MSTTSNVYSSEGVPAPQKDQQTAAPGYVESAYNAAANLANAASATLSNTLASGVTPPVGAGAMFGGGTDPRLQDAYIGDNNVVTTPAKTIDESKTTSTAQPVATAQTYASQAYNAATNLAQTASNTIPSALGTAAPAAITDPTTQYRNRQPHVGGVGDLGTASESNVALLPEERANPEPLEGRGVIDTSSNNPALSDPVNIQSRLNARDPPVPYPEGGLSNVGAVHTRDVTTGGVGDLGTSSAADVARLPEERANPDPLAAVPGIGDPVSSGGKHATQDLPVGSFKSTQADTLADSGNVTMGPPKGTPGWKPTETQDRTPHSDSTNAQFVAQNLPADSFKSTQPDTFADMKAEEHKDEASSPTSPSKMDKLKGNVLIAKGKLTKTQEDVEHGKRLKEFGKTE